MSLCQRKLKKNSRIEYEGLWRVEVFGGGRVLFHASPQSNELGFFHHEGRGRARSDHVGGLVREAAVIALASVLSPRRRPRGITRTELGIDYVTEYEYDLEDRVTAIVYPSGRRVEYQRDILGRVTEVRAEVAGQMQPILTNITYRADGQMLSAEYGNGLAELREYDGQGRLLGKELIDSAGFVVEERTWTYDPAGNVIERTQSSATETFSYDPLDRLVGQDITSASDASWSYDYGPNHNRLSRQLEGEFGEDYAYQPQSNRLLRRTRPTPASSPPEGIYQRKSSYNQAGRLSEYSENGDVKARYTYNTFGLRTRKATDAGTKVFHYDIGITLLGESDEAGNPGRDYIWLNGRPVATVDAAGIVAYIHTDHLFTPRLATDASAAIVWSWEGEAFGDAGPVGSLTLNLRFPGQYFDAESGLHYNVMRDYDPALGRYMQSDPIGLQGSLNIYIYAAINPGRYLDPLGLKEDSLFDVEISLGLQLGATGRAGATSFSGGLDLGTFRMSTGQTDTAITQGAELSFGVSEFEFGGRVGRFASQSRLIGSVSDFFSVPAEALGSTPFQGDFFLNFPSAPGTSGSTDFSSGDFVVDIGAALGLGLEFSINLSEGVRRFRRDDGVADCW